MAQLTGLFQRGGSYYIRIVLPSDHPLNSHHTNGRLVHSLGPCSHKTAVIKGTVKRAEILGIYADLAVAPQQVLNTRRLAETNPIFLRDVYNRWLNGMPRSADTIATDTWSVD